MRYFLGDPNQGKWFSLDVEPNTLGILLLGEGEARYGPKGDQVLEAMDLRVLVFLVQNRRRSWTADEIIEAVLGVGETRKDSASFVSRRVGHLRQVFQDKKAIKTHRDGGYRFAWKVRTDISSVSSAIDNLAMAGATRNLAFVGRAEKLDELNSLLNDPNGSAAVVVVGGAGFGKTELVKEFINFSAVSSSSEASGSGSVSGGWKGRWWVDGSAAGEVHSLKQIYPILVGQDPPKEPISEANADSQSARLSWLVSLRRSVAQACSLERQLLILDNAESASQIADYRPANAGRLLATTRHQPIPPAVASVVDLDVMSSSDSRSLLVSWRKDLASGRYDSDLDEIAQQLGFHPLALAYIAASLARLPLPTPREILILLRNAEQKEESAILSEFSEPDLGTRYSLPVVQSLTFLIERLENKRSPESDPLALTLLTIAAFCHSRGLPILLLRLVTREPEGRVERSLQTLHERSIINVSQDWVSVHRLTQSIIRSRLKCQGEASYAAPLAMLLKALWDFYRDFDGEEASVHQLSQLRTACLPHAETALQLGLGFSNFIRTSSTLSPHLDSMVAGLRFDLSRHLMKLGQLGAAYWHLSATLKWEESQSAVDESRVSAAYGYRASILLNLGDRPGAMKDINESISKLESYSPGDKQGIARLYNNRARSHWSEGNLETALEDIERAIDWEQSSVSRNEYALTHFYRTLALIKRDQGHYELAEDVIEKSITWLESQSPRDDVELASVCLIRASIRTRRGDHDRALDDVNRGLEVWKAQKILNLYAIAGAYDTLFHIYLAQNNLSSADEALTNSILTRESQSPRQESSLADAYAGRATIRQRQGNLEPAKTDIDQAIMLFKANVPDDHRELVRAYEIRQEIEEALRDLIETTAPKRIGELCPQPRTL